MPLAVADRQHPRFQVHPYQKEPLLVIRVLVIPHNAGVWIRERIRRRFEAHSVLLYVNGGLALVPLEFYVAVSNHTDTIHIPCI